MEVVIRILLYLKYTIGRGIMFSRNNHLNVERGNLVTWKKFWGMSKGLCELLWVRTLLTKIGFKSKTEMNLFCDNMKAIKIVHNPIQHDCTKYIEIDRHFIKQNLEKIIRFSFIQSKNQLVDMLTKIVSSK
ncbi:Copia protein, partial [Mucuna pruriens]